MFRVDAQNDKECAEKHMDLARRFHRVALLGGPDAQKDKQRAAIQMDLSQRFHRAAVHTENMREQKARHVQLQKGLYIGMVGMVGVVALALTKRYFTTDPKRALDAYESDLRTAKSAYDNMLADNISPMFAGRMLDESNSVARQRFATKTKLLEMA